MVYDEILFTQILINSEFEDEIKDQDIERLLDEVKRCVIQGKEKFAKYRKFEMLDYLLYAYISAKRGGEETEGIRRAIGTYIKGIFQSKKNYNDLLKGIKITSINRIPLNASILVQQSQVAFDFDDECELLFKAIGNEDISMYSDGVGEFHQKKMAENRAKVKQFAKKYKKN